MDDLISRQAAIDALDCINGVEEVLRSLPSAEPTITHEQAIDYLHKTGWLQNHDRILTESKIVPSAHPDVPVINVGDMISRQAATTIPVMPKEHRHYQTNNLDDAYEQGWNDLQECIENLPTVQPKNGTLVIPLNDSDFKSVKRIMLDNKPWCRMFYEEGGEAHWIKKYTPDDGEVYECDNCGVTWQFNDGGPEENEAFYCPKCGFKMMPKEGEENGI